MVKIKKLNSTHSLCYILAHLIQSTFVNISVAHSIYLQTTITCNFPQSKCREKALIKVIKFPLLFPFTKLSQKGGGLRQPGLHQASLDPFPLSSSRVI